VLVSGSVVLFVLVASQLLLPSFAERRVEDRLLEGGGSAEVTLGAVPALRLLFSDGERFEIDAEGLDLDLDERIEVFDRLDGFNIVGITIDDSRAGPFELEHFSLTRDAPAPYSMTSSGHTTAAALADFGADSLGLPGGPLAGMALGTLFGSGAIPIELDVRLASEGGEVEVVEGDATVAGIPAGPVADIITSAIVSRL
jgi:hypothetical protein